MSTTTKRRGRPEAPVTARTSTATFPPAPPPRRYGPRVAWTMTASGWSANQFSALLGAYRTEAGLSQSAVTGLFAVYVVGLIPGLLAGGPLADRYGRRPVALTALGLNLLSTCMLMAGAAAPWCLLPGRFVTGVGAGALLAAGSAWVKELSSPPYDPDGAPATAAKRSGMFVSAGFASGGLAAALIAQWAPAPMVTAYLPHLALAVGAGAAAYRAPESLPARARPGAAVPPTDPVPWSRFRRTILPLAPWVFAAPTIGFVTLPGLVAGGLTGWQTVYAGVATALAPGCGLAVQPLARLLAARHHLVRGTAGPLTIALGLAVAATAAATAQPWWALAATAILGAGYGLTLSFALTEVTALAPRTALARLTALFWTLAYLGMFAPYALTALSTAFGPPALLRAGALLAVGSCVLFGWLNRSRRTVTPRSPG
ncbi:MFS transporter [Streptomyces lydicus]|uniref:MFS transporter n=1 Tax=Streptomyces lydicus TaxID=47763 RepID=UPI002E37B867|nr:MFS transporter [Streptomyces lydicus]